MSSNLNNNYYSNDFSYNNQKIDNTSKGTNLLLKDLKNEIDILEKEKLSLLKSVEELKERTIDLDIAKNPEKLKLLEKERDDLKKIASDKLLLSAKMGEDLIILRDKLDKFYHN